MIDISQSEYWVSNDKKEPVFATNDFHAGMKRIKGQPAGYKLIRTKDGATLAYTTGFKQPPAYMIGGK